MIDPGTATLIASGFSTGADILGGSSARSQAKEQSQKMMDFQERMSSTAYQRAVKDMKAAGLNPALMYGSGGPASTPAGSAAPIENILEDSGDQVVSSALDARRLRKEIEQTDSNIDRNKADAALAKANAEAVRANSARSRKLSTYIDLLPEAGPLLRRMRQFKDIDWEKMNKNIEKGVIGE